MFTRTIQKKNLPGSRFQKWSRELALKVCFTCYFWYLVLRRKNVAFFRCYIQGTQNEVSIFIFFYKTPRNETVVLCRRIARRNLTLDLNVPSGSDISVELYTKDNSYYTQDTYSLNNCLAGIAISDNYSSI